MRLPAAAKCFMSAAALLRILSRTYTRPTTLKNHGHALVVMTYPIPIPQEKYNNFYRYLTEKVMKDVF